MGKIYRIQFEQVINTSLDKAWDFFSAAENLQRITPSYMRFNVTSPQTGKPVYAGQVITYIVRPVLGIPLRWMTEITHVKEGEYFIDEQRRGPYNLWHHQHHFKTIAGGVEMTDIVHYEMPFGIIGRLAHGLFVKKQLEGIFAYRKEKVNELFNR